MLHIGDSLLDFMLLPAVLVAAIGGLALILRWSSSPAKRASIAQPYGLLVSLATYPHEREAEAVAHTLRVEGIKASTAVRGAEFVVFIWPAQRPLAEQVLAQLHGDVS
ncbi:MAG: hypothetical protein ACR2FL_02145 [Nocardioidaceae bacterium]